MLYHLISLAGYHRPVHAHHPQADDPHLASNTPRSFPPLPELAARSWRSPRHRSTAMVKSHGWEVQRTEVSMKGFFNSWQSIQTRNFMEFNHESRKIWGDLSTRMVESHSLDSHSRSPIGIGKHPKHDAL